MKRTRRIHVLRRVAAEWAAVAAVAVVLGVAADVADSAAPVAVASASRDDAPPRIVVEPDTVDLGPVRDDDDAVADFVVRNAGGRDLHIERVEPT